MEPQFFEGTLWIGGMPGTAKFRDLLANPRFALHTATVDTQVTDGDAKVWGTVEDVHDAELHQRYARNLYEETGFDLRGREFDHFFATHLVGAAAVEVGGGHMDVTVWRDGALRVRRPQALSSGSGGARVNARSLPRSPLRPAGPPEPPVTLEPMSDARPRLLVFIVAYYAESTLTSVLERIPAQVFDDYDCEILVVDDASDRPHLRLGREYQRAHPEIRMTVLRNELNQGYGGNQKIGYTFAIERGFDIVALVHGDGQYAPEELPRLLDPAARRPGRRGVRQPDDDGLRCAARRHAAVQVRRQPGAHRRCRTRCCAPASASSTAATGPTRCAALRRIRFPLNSNDFHFDTEIIIQLLNARQRIVEVPIPTYYGDEICYVDGVRYAKDVMLTTFQMVAHGVGVFNQRRFEPLDDDGHANSHYDVKLGYASSHQFALDAVPPGSRVLDIGAGPGRMAQELVAKGCEVTVVDQFPAPDAPGDVEVHPAGPRRAAGLRRPQVRPPAHARRDRAPQGPRGVPRAARRPVRLRAPDAGAHHPERRRSPRSG